MIARAPDDVRLLEALAAGRPIADLEFARQRTTGVVAAAWRDGRIIRICAHRCGLTALPPLHSLARLERLDVGNNALTALPDLPSSVRQLYINDNRIAALPALPALDVLDANRNALTAVPALHDVAFVYLAANQLRTAPTTRGVRYLNVGENPLDALVVHDAAIRELRAEHAGVAHIALDGMTALRELSLRGNRLAAVPPALGALPALRVLDLRANLLDDVPANLQRLDKLDLRWNPLRTPPPWLGEPHAARLVYT